MSLSARVRYLVLLGVSSSVEGCLLVRSYVVADLSGNLVEVHCSKDNEPTFLSSVFEFTPLHILDYLIIIKK